MKTGKVFASAGCGKTTKLLDIVDEIFTSKQLKPSDVMFTTFTRSGAYEAQERAIRKFNFHENQFTYFRTLHSICFRAAGSPNLMVHRDYYALAKAMGIRFGANTSYTDMAELGKGDALLSLYNYQRNLTLEEVDPQDHGCTFTKQEYEHFIETYSAYKDARGKYDYTDLIAEIAEQGHPLPIRYAIIDEAQDLTRLQWGAIQKLAARAEWLWLAGDDDQSIYTYSGADPDILINLKADETVKLETSYRLPMKLSKYANTISARIENREPKVITPSQITFDGFLDRVDSIAQASIDPTESTVVLVRNRMYAETVAEDLLARGILCLNNCITDKLKDEIETVNLYSTLLMGDPITIGDLQRVAGRIPVVLWRRNHREVLKRPPEAKITHLELTQKHNFLATQSWVISLSLLYTDILCPHSCANGFIEPPSVQINTIHTFKGREVDHAIVLPDMSWQTYRSFMEHPEREHRTFFVAVTRARRRLTLLNPMTSRYYNL